jgi:hypothetical protein
MKKSVAALAVLAMVLTMAIGCDQGPAETGEGHEPCPSNFVVQPEEVAKLDGSTAAALVAPAPSAEPARKLSRLVLITTTKACECTMKRCKGAEAALEKDLKEMPGLPALEKINMAEEPEKARELAMKHQAAMLPVVLLLDGKDELIVKLEGEFTEEDLAKALAAQAKGSEAK